MNRLPEFALLPHKNTPDCPHSESRTESALGALQGALAGDAAGATLEMLGRKPDQADVMKAMMMFGGGVWIPVRPANGRVRPTSWRSGI